MIPDHSGVPRTEGLPRLGRLQLQGDNTLILQAPGSGNAGIRSAAKAAAGSTFRLHAPEGEVRLPFALDESATDLTILAAGPDPGFLD